MPLRKWAGYAVLIAGLLLLVDTETFLATNWSPLNVPLSVPAELSLACFLVVCGIVVLLVPAFIRMVSAYAPGGSVRTGEDFEHETVELRLRRRLPLKPRLSALSDRGVVGGTIVLLLLVPFFAFSPPTPTGIYVRLSPRFHQQSIEDSVAGPIVVSLRGHNGSARLLLNGNDIRREELAGALRTKLAGRANRIVYVEGDEDLSYSEPMYVFDVISSLYADAVILTPKLKAELAVGNRPRQ